MLYDIHSLKIGLKVIYNNEPCLVIGNECVKPGKGQAFNRVKLKQIVSGKFLEKTLKSGEYLESANILDIKLIYVYRDSNLWYFMNEKNFDQIFIHSSVVGETAKWMVEKLSYIITFWDDNPILVTPPDYVKLKIIKTVAFIKNYSVSSKNKLVTVITGAVIKVPLFIQSGELIKIDTRTGSYVSRAK